MAIDPLLSAYADDYILPPSQGATNAAIIAIFAYLVALLTMEINYFRLAIHRSWLRMARSATLPKEEDDGGGAKICAAGGANDRRLARRKKTEEGEGVARGDDDDVGTLPSKFDACNAMPPQRQLQRLHTIHSANYNDDVYDINIMGGMSLSSYLSITGDYDQGEELAEEDECCLDHSHNDNHDTNPNNSSDDYDDSNNDDGMIMIIIDDNHDANAADNTNNKNDATNKLLLRRTQHYQCIRHASAEAILSSLFIYTLTAWGVGYSTVGLDSKVIAIIAGGGQFVTAVMIVIMSAKIPQWIGVYHQGSIRLVKCSSNYSQNFTKSDLYDPATIRTLRNNVRLGIWFHFAKFYILLMPFYCGVQASTIPVSISIGLFCGFVLMWVVFLVHEKFIQHRNIVSTTTILLLSILSAVSFTRGMAWIQVVWNWHVLDNDDLLLVSSFFAWLGMLATVHALFIWHTLKTDVAQGAVVSHSSSGEEEGKATIDSNNNVDTSNEIRKSKMSRSSSKVSLRRNDESYSSFVFDPITHLRSTKDSDQCTKVDTGSNEEEEDDLGFYIESPVVMVDNLELDMCNDESSSNKAHNGLWVKKTNDCGNEQGVGSLSRQNNLVIKTTNHHCPTCCRHAFCDVFVWNTPEYQRSSYVWKFLCWLKLIVITLSYLLCLFFVTVCIGATKQVTNTKTLLPSVHEALYTYQNIGPVCAFDNKGSESNITTFVNKDAAHDAGFLIVHCGACGACSSWQNMAIQYSTRMTLASLSQACAQESLFQKGDEKEDGITNCLMEPTIGFDEACAVCWMEDIVCTVNNCAYIYLQSLMINNIGNFRVGPDDVTSATCEEAHCEVGKFVPCVGATRRRMNITSSIARPGDQQCAIIDVDDWDDLFFGSGIA